MYVVNSGTKRHPEYRLTEEKTDLEVIQIISVKKKSDIKDIESILDHSGLFFNVKTTGRSQVLYLDYLEPISKKWDKELSIMSVKRGDKIIIIKKHKSRKCSPEKKKVRKKSDVKKKPEIKKKVKKNPGAKKKPDIKKKVTIIRKSPSGESNGPRLPKKRTTIKRRKKVNGD
jgi:hypothetical protein